MLSVCLGFLALIVLEWFCYLVMRSVRRTGFEPETIAFFLSTLGMEVCASSTPDEMFTAGAVFDNRRGTLSSSSAGG